MMPESGLEPTAPLRVVFRLREAALGAASSHESESGPEPAAPLWEAALGAASSHEFDSSRAPSLPLRYGRRHSPGAAISHASESDSSRAPSLPLRYGKRHSKRQR
jgi:hypothetical protein